MLEIAGHCNKNVHFEFFGELFWRAIEVDDDILGLHIGVNIMVRNSHEWATIFAKSKGRLRKGPAFRIRG